MSTGVDLLFGVAIFFSGILAGGVVTVSLAMIPALWSFDPRTEFRVHKIFNPLPDYYMPHACFISSFAGIGVLIAADHLSSTSKALIWVALGVAFAVIVISLAGNRRINLIIRRWDRAELPDGYAHMRRVWDIAHWTRSAGCLVMCICYTIAAGPQTAWDVLSVVFGALVGGGLLIVLLAVMPTFHRVGEEIGIRLHVAFDHYVEFFLPPFTVAAILFSAGVLVFHDHLPTASVVLVAAGIVGMIAVALISHLFNRPMNQIIRSWPVGTVPPEYPAMRRRWDRLHRTRTFFAVAGFVCLMLALLASN